MKTNQWMLFAAVQLLGIMLASFSNLHTAGLSFLLGFLLLAPGIFLSSKIGLPAGSAIIAVLINAVAWHFLFKICKPQNLQ